MLRAYWEFVRAVAYKVLGDEEAAEEVAQETFVRFYRYRSAFDPSRNLRAYLGRIARNQAIDALNGRNKGRRLTDEILAALVVAVDWEIDPEYLAEVRAAIDPCCDPRGREIMQLRLTEGLSDPEIAARLNLTCSNVRSYLAKIRKCIRRRLRGFQQDAAGGGTD